MIYYDDLNEFIIDCYPEQKFSRKFLEYVETLDPKDWHSEVKEYLKASCEEHYWQSGDMSANLGLCDADFF